jgi:two-component system, NtrC family, response regulator PilR
LSDLSRARPASAHTLLVIDDEPDLRTLYELTLVREGYEIDTAGSVEEALVRLAETSYSAIITDMRLPDGSGLDLLRELEENGRGEKAIVITAYGSAENAVEALKAGAYDYLTKPVDLKQFRTVVASALGRAAAPAVHPGPAVPSSTAPVAGSGSPLVPPAAPPPPPSPRVRSPASPPGAGAMGRMAGRSLAMQAVRALVHKVARSMAPVLVQGESGTGKELVARAIHEVSARGAQPFVAVNCGAIPEQLLEAEFFGYRKGAFTGAAEDRAGFFHAANGGTLFLDEIGDLPIAMQSKLLRAIQERAVRPIGATAELQVDVRLLSATHKDLAAEVQAGRFRQDLYYRLNVIQIRVPPLRERIEDLADIAGRVLERIARDAGVSPAPRLTPSALAHLAAYGFPGNVRELENLLHRVVALCDGEQIDVADLGLPPDAGDTQRGTLQGLPEAPAAGAGWVPTQPMGWLSTPLPGPVTSPPAAVAAAPVPAMSTPAVLPSNLEAYLDGVERDILVRALERHRNNRTAAGASLGLSLRQMRYRMARLQVGVGSDADPTRDAGGSPDAEA